ncbi:MAG: peptidylprolyl isomerase [Pseudonocardiales bacterium]|nr:peptidylprolyl isomerase [Pseudonocardiales bacterium]
MATLSDALPGLWQAEPVTNPKPTVDPYDGPVPTDLVIEELATGDGAEAQPGQTVEVHYVGVAHSTGEEFDASYNRGSTFRFPLGAGRVIAGWDQGVAGMKVGGRRKLVIPPHLGYGDRGAGGAIKGGETLIFVVDLLGVS